MLQTFRNKAQSKFIQAIVVVIALVFIFWGVGTNMMNNRESAILVNGEEVTFQELQKAYDVAYNRVRQQFGGTIPKGLAESLQIKEQVINQLIQETLLEQGAGAMGVRVSGIEVRDKIQAMEEFQVEGVFNLNKYKELLGSNGFTANSFEAKMSRDMLADRVIQSIEQFGVTVTDFEVDDLYTIEKEKVSVKYAKISPDLFTAQVQPTQEELTAWHEQIRDKFKTEPKAKIKYIQVQRSDVAAKIAIDEEKIAAAYKEDPGRFNTPELRQASHILFRTNAADSEEKVAAQRKKAEEVLQLAKAGQDFARLAEQYSEGPTKATGGQLGTFPQGQMVKPFDDAVFSMQPGSISDLVQTQFGFHIIKLEGIIPASTKTLADVRETLRDSLKAEEAKGLTFQVANDIYESIFAAGSLQAYSDATPETTITETDFFSLSSPPAALSGDQELLEKIFQLKKGELSSLLETAGGYAIVFVEETKAPVVKPFTEIEDEVKEDYVTSKTSEIAKEEAAKLLTALQEGTDFSEAAQASNTEVEESGPLSRVASSEDAPFPATLVQQTFRLSPSAPLPEEPALVGQDYFVFQFQDRTPPETTLAGEERQRYHDALVNMKKQQILAAWLDHMERNSEISTHKNI